MPDLFHQFGNDLTVSASGDLATVDGTPLGEQRVLRRILTNQGAYIWELTYGAGLPAKIGSTIQSDALTGLILTQMYLEDIVARTPLPTVLVTKTAPGIFSVSIKYTDAYTGLQASLSFDLGE